MTKDEVIEKLESGQVCEACKHNETFEIATYCRFCTIYGNKSRFELVEVEE